MEKTADKPSRSSSSPAWVAKKSSNSKPVAAAKKTMKTNPMASIKNIFKGKSDANLVSSVCRQANEVLKDLDTKKVSGLAVKGMVKPVCRMLCKAYGVDSL